LTLVELVFLVEVDVDALLETDVTFLVDVLKEDVFFVEVVIFCEDEVDDFKNPATRFLPAEMGFPAEFFNQQVPSPRPLSPPTYAKATHPEVVSQAVIQSA
jgi:hypothetical protein